MATCSSDKKGTVVKVGSRSSELAMVQTNSVVRALQAAHPGVEFVVTTMETIGDKVQDRALQQIGQTNLFTKELEKALALGEVDLLVHSLKDVPTTLPDGMTISAVCKREDPRDALILHPKWQTDSGSGLHSLPPNAVIGTSSLRRIAQLKAGRPQLQFKTVRGNLNTRLHKLDESGDYDALVLAVAGMERLGWSHRISQRLDSSTCMYAVGQGALGVETRTDNSYVNSLVECLNDKPTLVLCSAERACLHELGGGCSVPVGINSVFSDDTGLVTIRCAVISLDGSKRVEASIEQSFSQLGSYTLGQCRTAGNELGSDLGHQLIDRGAGAILSEVKREMERQ